MRWLTRMVALAALCAAGAAAFVVFDARPAGPCAGATLRVRVPAAPEIAPAVARVAARYTEERHAVDGRCVAVSVTARPAATVAGSLAAGRDAADAWVPDSAAWADDVRRARGAEFLPDGPVIATTPVVFAVPPARAAEARRMRLGWRELLASADPVFGAYVPDPARDAAGVAALSALRVATGGGPAGVTRLAAAFTGLRTYAPGDAAAWPAGGDGPRLIVTTEQAAADRLRVRPGSAAVIYPSDGSPAVAYRYLVSTRDRLMRRAAWGFGAELLTARAGRAYEAAGFRRPGAAHAAFAARDGLDPGPVSGLSVAGGETERRVRAMWARRHGGVRVLVALDASASMGTPVRDGPATRLELAARGARAWLPGFGASDAAGLWTFGPRTAAVPYQRAVPVAPLGAAQRASLTAALAAARPAAADGTGLYATVLAAYQQATRDYRPGGRNAVLVITDGGDKDPAGPSLAHTVRALAAAYDPRRPVDLSIIAAGPDTDPAALRSLAAAVRGSTWTSDDPSEAPGFLAQYPAHLACATWCP